MDKNSNHCAVLLYVSQVFLDILSANWVLPFLGILGECLLLGSVPVTSIGK